MSPADFFDRAFLMRLAGFENTPEDRRAAAEAAYADLLTRNDMHQALGFKADAPDSPGGELGTGIVPRPPQSHEEC